MPIAITPFNSAQGAIDAAQTHEEACENLVTFWVAQGVPFTSGHVVNAIRQGNPTLRFSQKSMGEFIRRNFAAGFMPSYDDGLGGEIPVKQVERQTESTATRTPVGTVVCVYGPSVDECESFEFEINIAEAEMVSDGQGGQTSAATAMLNATPNPQPGQPVSSIPPVPPNGVIASAQGDKMVSSKVFALVHADGRLCIPRLAFEALAYETGVPVVGGEPVYTMFASDKVLVCQTSFPGSKPANPTTDRLRLHLTVPSVNTPIPPGKEYEIEVGQTFLTITL